MMETSQEWKKKTEYGDVGVEVGVKKWTDTEIAERGFNESKATERDSSAVEMRLATLNMRAQF
jgi:hypothetical protein